jgi:hypothetical protein
LSDENGPDDTSGTPEEEEQVEDTRRVRPLFRFGRKNSKNAKPPTEERTAEVPPETPVDDPEMVEDSQGPVRPVRVVKFIPFGNKETQEEPVVEEEGPAFTEPEVAPEETPFAVEEGEAAFEVEKEEPAFEVEGGEAAFEVEEETPFAVEEGETAFEVEEEAPAPIEAEPAPFAVEAEEEEPFAVEAAEEEPFAVEAEEEEPFAVEAEEEEPFAVETEEEAVFSEVQDVPSASGEALEETLRLEPVHDSVSVQEEAETGEEFEFRSEESATGFETPSHPAKETVTPAPPGDETKPHYHKYLKPDEELLQRKQTKGPATGFDRDMDADAGEIDFGIDLIDPSERRKRQKKTPRKDEGPGLKKGVGGHDSDGEVDSRGMGADIGVDYQKRRKRRL